MFSWDLEPNSIRIEAEKGQKRGIQWKSKIDWFQNTAHSHPPPQPAAEQTDKFGVKLKLSANHITIVSLNKF